MVLGVEVLSYERGTPVDCVSVAFEPRVWLDRALFHPKPRKQPHAEATSIPVKLKASKIRPPPKSHLGIYHPPP